MSSSWSSPVRFVNDILPVIASFLGAIHASAAFGASIEYSAVRLMNPTGLTGGAPQALSQIGTVGGIAFVQQSGRYLPVLWDRDGTSQRMATPFPIESASPLGFDVLRPERAVGVYRLAGDGYGHAAV
jgi:hypothetical protein